jgi:hypothetical protein
VTKRDFIKAVWGGIGIILLLSLLPWILGVVCYAS